jgi:antitoxin component YwqK of YwqJK toxin-antitoxin module
MKTKLLTMLLLMGVVSIFMGCRETRYTYYGDNPTKVKTEVQFDKNSGKADGYAKTYYENGRIKEEGNFKQGKKHGDFKGYNKNGSLKEECSYKDDKRHGKRRVWHDDGSLFVDENYKDGERDGKSMIMSSYFDNLREFRIKQETFYEKGKWISQKCFCPNGKMAIASDDMQHCYDDNNKEVACNFAN